MHDYKSLYAAVTLCNAMLNIQTHTQHFGRLIRKAQPTELKTQLNQLSHFDTVSKCDAWA